ncbi:unnamed protein product [Mycetohabitans rhizoxinica HKI 454]|uniref:Uncharacterized protein n=1 Tax=Mycetohabitans rhizoxinica (strain DSM 19002 / CIP 109453 / HKI 454) TaxID=882378 RepID=E5AMZ6_MYCRK|nr:unnamed protein product [Mycetohabitans rhizoxinica HKI 454]
MHAVEVADRQRAGRAALGIWKTPEDSHDDWPVGLRRWMAAPTHRAGTLPQSP